MIQQNKVIKSLIIIIIILSIVPIVTSAVTPQTSAGRYHTVAIKSDGTLWAWGTNSNGQLGLGDTTQRTSPTQVGADTNWTNVSAGYYHTIAIKSDGMLWAWGYNEYGQLGLGDTTQRTSPTQVGTDTNWTNISAGFLHTVAMKSNGTLWSWGYNAFGQLGLGDTTQRTSPTQVGTDTNWTKVSAGHYRTVAMKSDGTLWSWGYNVFGQLGQGDTTQRTSPTQVGTDSDWTKVSAGRYHTVAMKSDGTLWAWGYNEYGQLGLGTTTQSNSPTQVGADTNWTNVSPGDYHTVAMKSNGTLWAWGYNEYGQLGLGDIIQRTTPQIVTAFGATDTTDPVVNTVTLDNTTPNTGEAILVTVNATDNVAVTNVTADGIELTHQVGNIWNGTITTSEGTQYVNVSAKDVAGNTAWNNSTSYTADTIDPVVNTVTLNNTTPDTGDAILVTVNATDNVAVTNVTADGVELTPQGGNIWNGTITAEEGTQYVNVSAKDAAGNTAWNNSTSYIVITKTLPSSGGRGGIGVSSSNEPENVEETVVLRIFLEAGSISIYNFNNLVTSVEVTPNRTYGQVAARVEVLASRPGSIISDPPVGELYKYVNVFIGTTGWSEGKFSSSVINFEIPASWFEENNIDPASVTLYRYHDGEWQPLATTITGQAGGHYQYSSPTPGFSTFLILGQAGDSGAGEHVATHDSGTVAGSTATPEATSTSTKGIPGFGILGGIMGILIAVYSKRK